MTQLLETSKIKPAKYNPKSRTEKLNGLVKSIKEHGIIIPLIVDSENNLVDGHRRLASAKLLKMEKVPTIKIENKISKDLAYEVVNTNAKRISPGEYIFIHLNGGSVPRIVLNQIELMTELVGEDGVKKLGDIGASWRILDAAYRVAKYCHNLDNKFRKKIVFWLAFNKMTFQVRRAMDQRVNNEIIKKAIALNRPLKVKYA